MHRGSQGPVSVKIPLDKMYTTAPERRTEAAVSVINIKNFLRNNKAEPEPLSNHSIRLRSAEAVSSESRITKEGGMRLRAFTPHSGPSNGGQNGPSISGNGPGYSGNAHSANGQLQSPSNSQNISGIQYLSTESQRTSIAQCVSGDPSQIQEDASVKDKIKMTCASTVMRKVFCGLLVLSLVTSTWVAATQFLKATYKKKSNYTETSVELHTNQTQEVVYSAPFLTTWFCTTWTLLFFPLYMISLISCSCCCGNKVKPGAIFQQAIRNFKDKGFTIGSFLSQCMLFCLLSVLTNYLYISSLRILECTVVTTLFATNAAFVYLLSWVVLHTQFVGVRIVAVILCNTGIALLAYMDGVNQNQTLLGVVLAAAAAAGSAVYKVMFKKVIGDVSFSQVALFFSLIGLLNATVLWPMGLFLHFTGLETINLQYIPWMELSCAAALSLGANLLANLSIIITYENFITLGLVTAVPVCAVYDTLYNEVKFYDMKLAGVLIVCFGFILVLFPANWAELLASVVRWGKQRRNPDTEGAKQQPADFRTGHIGSRLRSPSGRVK